MNSIVVKYEASRTWMKKCKGHDMSYDPRILIVSASESVVTRGKYKERHVGVDVFSGSKKKVKKVTLDSCASTVFILPFSVLITAYILS